MKRVFLCVFICLSSFLMIGCGCSKDKEPVDRIEQDELSGRFFETQTIDGIEISNFTIASEDEGSSISFDVKNTLADNIDVEYIKIYFYDNTDYLIIDSFGYVGGTLSVGESKHIVVDTDVDLSATARVVYEKM